MLEAGIHDISAALYHSDPCETPSLSASMVKILVKETPQHAWTAHPRLNPNFETDDDTKFSVGNASHALHLGDPQKFAILDFDTFQSKDSKKARDQAFADGKIPILLKHWDRVVEMTSAGREQLDSVPDFADVFRTGQPEQTLIWSEGDGADKVWFRGRLDWLHDDHAKPYDDFKSTACADPGSWSRIVFNVRHDIQAAFYRRGIRALGLNRNPVMRFIVQEVEAPYCLSVMQPAPEVLELADREIERAIRRWKWCRGNDRWPGYTAKVHTFDIPGWMETQRMEREITVEETAKREGVDPDLLALSFKFQSPDPEVF